jgi:hypothetical protein
MCHNAELATQLFLKEKDSTTFCVTRQQSYKITCTHEFQEKIQYNIMSV